MEDKLKQINEIYRELSLHMTNVNNDLAQKYLELKMNKFEKNIDIILNECQVSLNELKKCELQKLREEVIKNAKDVRKLTEEESRLLRYYNEQLTYLHNSK